MDSCVLVPGSTAVLPRVGEFELPPAPRMDEASWRCRKLWLAALQAVLSDAAYRGMGALLHKTLAKSAARAWLRRPSRDRSLVLEMAGIDEQAFDDFGLPYLEARWAKLDDARQQPRHTFRRKAA